MNRIWVCSQDVVCETESGYCTTKFSKYTVLMIILVIDNTSRGAKLEWKRSYTFNIFEF